MEEVAVVVDGVEHSELPPDDGELSKIYGKHVKIITFMGRLKINSLHSMECIAHLRGLESLFSTVECSAVITEYSKPRRIHLNTL